METHPLKKETVRNWVGSALGLRSLRDGLYPFVKTNVTEFHSYLKARVQSTCQIKEYTCTKCTIDTLSINHLGNCPHREKKRCLCSARKGGQRVTCLQSNACGQMYECITEEHVHKSPSWERIDVSRWSCDPFAVASCFCNNPDSGDLELTALVNICLNNKYIRAKIQVSTQHLLDKIRHSRNEIIHQFNYEVSTNDMKRYLGTMKKLLQEKDINISPEAKQGVTAITQLMKGEIHIVNEELCDAINEAKKAVTTDLNELKLKLNDVETLSDDFRKLKDDVQKVQNILTEQENSPILKRICKLEKGHEQHDRRICDIEKWRKEIDRIIRASQNSTLNGNECKVNLNMNLENVPQHCAEQVTKDVEDSLQACASGQVDNTDVASAAADIANTLRAEGKELQQAKKKCILLTFKCHTLESLGSLLLECLSGKITELFIPMRTALRTKYNCQLLDLEVCLYEKDFLDCLDDISQHLKDAFITENVDAFDSLPIENTDFQMYLIDRARNQLDSRDMIFFSFLEESIQETFVDPLFIRNGQHASASDLQQSIKELQKSDENKCLLLTGEQGMGKTEICRTPLYAWVQKTKGKSRTNAVEKTTAQYSYFQNAAQQAVESIEFVIFIPLNKKQTELKIEDIVLSSLDPKFVPTFKRIYKEFPRRFMFILDDVKFPFKIECRSNVLMSTREQFYHLQLPQNAIHIQIEGLDYENIANFAKYIACRLFPDTHKARNFVSRILNADQVLQVKSFARNPLLFKFFMYLCYCEKKSSFIGITKDNFGIKNICLNHTQSAMILSLPIHLYSESLQAESIICETDSECGCQNRLTEHCLDHAGVKMTIPTNCSVSGLHLKETQNVLRHTKELPFVEQMNFVHISWMSDIVHLLGSPTPLLRLLKLEDMRLQHSIICHLLCDIPSLKEVFLVRVDSRKDDDCKCSNPAALEKEMHIEMLQMDSCSQILVHIEKALNVKTILLKNVYARSDVVRIFGNPKCSSIEHLSLDNIRLTHTEIVQLLCDNETITTVSLKNLKTQHDFGCKGKDLEPHKKYSLKTVLYLEVQSSKGFMSLIHHASMLKKLHLEKWDSVKKILQLTIDCKLLNDLYVDVDQISHTEATTLFCGIPSLQRINISTKSCVVDSVCGCRQKPVRKQHRKQFTSLCVRDVSINMVACLYHIKDFSLLEQLTTDVDSLSRRDKSILFKSLRQSHTLRYLTFNGTQMDGNTLVEILYALPISQQTLTVELLSCKLTGASSLEVVVEAGPPNFKLKTFSVNELCNQSGQKYLLIEDAAIMLEQFQNIKKEVIK